MWGTLAHIDFYLDNPHQVSVSFPYASVDVIVNIDTDTDVVARCGQGLNQLSFHGLVPKW